MCVSHYFSDKFDGFAQKVQPNVWAPAAIELRRGVGVSRQVMTGTFEACAKLLSHHRERLSIDQRMDLHFVDYDLVPTMVQE